MANIPAWPQIVPPDSALRDPEFGKYPIGRRLSPFFRKLDLHPAARPDSFREFGEGLCVLVLPRAFHCAVVDLLVIKIDGSGVKRLKQFFCPCLVIWMSEASRNIYNDRQYVDRFLYNFFRAFQCRVLLFCGLTSIGRPSSLIIW